MKVLFLLSICLGRRATSGHLLIAMIRALCKSGHTVNIIQQDGGKDIPAIPESLAEYPVTTALVPYKNARKGNFIARYWAEICYLKACKKQISHGYNAVFIQSTTNAGQAVRIVRKKLPRASVTLNVQDIFPYNAAFIGSIKQNGFLFRTLAKQQRYGYRHADRIITISEDMKDLLVEDGTPADKIDVIYNWSYQDEPYTGLDLSAVDHMFDRQKFNVVYAGNIGAIQNVELLIEAAKLLEKDTGVWFHIIGEGVRKQAVETKAKERGTKNISFWPMQPPELAPYIYSAASINVIPLKKNICKTCLPSKIATCLACGRPIIFAFGKESRFAQKLVQETGCILVDSDDPRALADAIQTVRNGEAKDQNTTEFFQKNCGITENSRRYAEIITSRNGG